MYPEAEWPTWMLGNFSVSQCLIWPCGQLSLLTKLNSHKKMVTLDLNPGDIFGPSSTLNVGAYKLNSSVGKSKETYKVGSDLFIRDEWW